MTQSQGLKKFLCYNLPVLLVFLLYFLMYTTYKSVTHHDTTITGIDDMLTVRVNTYRRLDMLKVFIESYSKCDVVKQVQIVWSDQENSPPADWITKYPDGKFIYEVHKNNSLSNRFRSLIDVPTEAVLSIDDDLIIPCVDLHKSLEVWKSNKRVLVGFSPRMHANNIVTGMSRYLNWQFTWWSGIYSIVLTKGCLLHRDYLPQFDKIIPSSMLQHIDEVKNCEDISMAYVVALQSKAAPVWVKATVYEMSSSGISSGKAHFVDRSKCLDMLKATTKEWPWVTGYQKVIPFSWTDYSRTYHDTK